MIFLQKCETIVKRTIRKIHETQQTTDKMKEKYSKYS